VGVSDPRAAVEQKVTTPVDPSALTFLAGGREMAPTCAGALVQHTTGTAAELAAESAQHRQHAAAAEGANLKVAGAALARPADSRTAVAQVTSRWVPAWPISLLRLEGGMHSASHQKPAHSNPRRRDVSSEGAVSGDGLLLSA
jgi:hypothetical protein